MDNMDEARGLLDWFHDNGGRHGASAAQDGWDDAVEMYTRAVRGEDVILFIYKLSAIRDEILAFERKMELRDAASRIQMNWDGTGTISASGGTGGSP